MCVWHLSRAANYKQLGTGTPCSLVLMQSGLWDTRHEKHIPYTMSWLLSQKAYKAVTHGKMVLLVLENQELTSACNNSITVCVYCINVGTAEKLICTAPDSGCLQTISYSAWTEKKQKKNRKKKKKWLYKLCPWDSVQETSCPILVLQDTLLPKSSISHKFCHHCHNKFLAIDSV